MLNLIYTIVSIACLITGFYFGFKIGKTSDIPKVSEGAVKDTIKKIKHPIKTAKEEKEQEQNENDLEKAIRNLDNFDGTASSQEDF